MSTQNHQNLRPYLGLYQCRKVGLATIYKMAEMLNVQIAEIWTTPPKRLKALGLDDQQINTITSKTEQSQTEQAKILASIPSDVVVLTIADDAYPACLKEISDPPLFLFAQGDISLLQAASLAIVGTRHPSQYGLNFANECAQTLAGEGWVIVSGLAQGVDAAAHRGAISVNGATVAVLGHGIKHTYPKQHGRLREQIVASGGLVLSEFLPNETPKPYFFPRRNRIVSGITKGVCIVEAGLQSGTLVTAHHAIAQNREVFALPGRVDDERNLGCHQLIQQGAQLINKSADILESFPLVENVRPKPHISYNNDEPTQNSEKQHLANQQLLDSVGTEVTSLDQIVAQTQLSVGQVLSQLTQLEITGRIKQTAGGYLKLQGRKYV